MKIYLKPLVVVLSGPSGSGKTTICRKVLKKHPEIAYSISCTTRKPRQGEKNGKDYHFISEEDFHKMIKDEKFLEWAIVYGSYYGTQKKPVLKAIEEGKFVLMDLDTAGMRQVKEKMHDSVSIFLLPPSVEELEQRILNQRGDPQKEARKRIEEAIGELDEWIEYDYVILNEDLKRSVEMVESIFTSLKAERSRLTIEIEEEVPR